MSDDYAMALEPEPPADPSRDQKAALLGDLERLRELAQPYLTGPGRDYRQAVTRLPAAERAECQQILDRVDTRIGPHNRAVAAVEEKLLNLLAQAEVGAYRMRDRWPGDQDIDRAARETLGMVESIRDRIVGTGQDGDN